MSSMYVFTRKWGNPICRVLLTVQYTHRRALLFIDNRQFIGFLHTKKLSSIYRHKLYCHLLGLDKASSVAYNSGETQTCSYFVLLFGRDRLWRNLRKRVARGGKL